MASPSRMSSVQQRVRNPLQLLGSDDADPDGARAVSLPTEKLDKYTDKVLEEELPEPTTVFGRAGRACTVCCCGKFPTPAKGWIMYDFSDSVFTIVSGLFLPAYVKQLAEDAGYPDGNSFWAFTTSIATGVSVAAFVILGGIGEYGDYKNIMARWGAYVGALSLACIGLTVVPELVLLAAALFVIARTGDRVSGLMIDGLLSDCCSHHAKTSHAVSANARYMGYIAMMTFGSFTGYAFLQADESLWFSRVPIMLGGLWWFTFAFIGFGWIGRFPGVPFPDAATMTGCCGALAWSARTTFTEHMTTIKKLPQFYDVAMFVLSWMFLSDASSTASSLGTLIAEQLGYSSLVVGAAVVLGIVFAALGMLLWMWVVKNHWLTPYQVLFINLCTQAAGALLLLGVTEEWQLFGIVFIVGVNLGPVSSYTRSIVVTMIPPGFQTNFLSFYELTQKGTALLGAEYFSLISIMTILAELLIGLPLFWLVDVERGQRLAQAYGEAEEARKGFTSSRGRGRHGKDVDPEADVGEPSSSSGRQSKELELAVVNPASVNGRGKSSSGSALSRKEEGKAAPRAGPPGAPKRAGITAPGVTTSGSEPEKDDTSAGDGQLDSYRSSASDKSRSSSSKGRVKTRGKTPPPPPKRAQTPEPPARK
ncbi:ATG22 [Symbiodinium sp. KB8]|nr:ATG22 [Symbiodinium sp. KB8]